VYQSIAQPRRSRHPQHPILPGLRSEQSHHRVALGGGCRGGEKVFLVVKELAFGVDQRAAVEERRRFSFRPRESLGLDFPGVHLLAQEFKRIGLCWLCMKRFPEL
jgi:hypothetical protein